MTLASLKNTYPDYRNTYSNSSIGHLEDYSVYADGDDKVGSVDDGLFDNATGQFRYLVVDTGIWIFGKKVLLPIGLAQFDNNERRIYVSGLSKKQVEHLPEYNSSDVIDYDYEESVRKVYRENAVGQSAPVSGTAAYTKDTYNYDYDTDLYTLKEESKADQPIRLYEERLVADTNRVKMGDVVASKRIETEKASVSIPVEKQRVVIERSTPTNKTAIAADHAFNEGEVARVEVYEDQANVRKEAVLREEVTLRKESKQEVVSEQATIRREELDVESNDDTTIINQ